MKQKLLVYGGTGLVGSRFLELFKKNFEIISPDSSTVNLTNSEAVEENINDVNPDQILYAAGYTNVEKAEKEQDLCYSLNFLAIKVIVNTSKSLEIPVHYLSTDYVFDGKKSDAPYVETDEPNPLSVYAKSKRDGEVATLESSKRNSVLRLIMPYAAVYRRKPDLVRIVLSKLRKKEKVFGVVDQNINPIFVDDLVKAVSEIIIKESSGIYHLGATNFTTPFKLVSLIAQSFDLEKDLIMEISFKEFFKKRLAKRPKHSWLDTSKFRKEFGEGVLHTLEEGLNLFKKQLQS